MHRGVPGLRKMFTFTCTSWGPSAPVNRSPTPPKTNPAQPPALHRCQVHMSPPPIVAVVELLMRRAKPAVTLVRSFKDSGGAVDVATMVATY